MLLTIMDIEAAPRGLPMRVASLLTSPSSEWARIEREQGGPWDICWRYACLLAAIPPACAAVGSIVFGVGLFGVELQPSWAAAVLEAGLGYGLLLGGLFVFALAIHALAPVFGGVGDRRQAFKVAAYSATPSWVAGVFLLAPQLSALSFTGLYSLVLIYRGLPRLMKTPREHALAYVLLIALTGLALMLAISSLTGPLTILILGVTRR